MISEKSNKETKTQLLEIAKRLLNNQKIDEIFDSNFLRSILINHPDYNGKMSKGCQGFVVKIDPVYKTKCFHVVGANGEQTKFSYIECIRHSTKMSDFKAAARKLVSQDIKQEKLRLFKEAMRHRCPLCGKPIGLINSHLDHHPISFNTIVEDFIEHYGIDVNKVKYGHDDYGVNMEDPHDFRSYHNDRASYRLLCKRCNLKSK